MKAKLSPSRDAWRVKRCLLHDEPHFHAVCECGWKSPCVMKIAYAHSAAEQHELDTGHPKHDASLESS